MEFAVVTVFTFLFALWFEPDSWIYPFTSIRNLWLNIIVIGLFEGLSYLLATLGQKHVHPSRAGILFSLESVVACCGGYIFLHEILTHIEILGCFLMLVASLLSSSSNLEQEEKEIDDDENMSLEEKKIVQSYGSTA